MNKQEHYYNWFAKIMAVVTDIFFVVAPLACLFVFTSPFAGVMRYVLFGLVLAVYCLVIYFLKDRIAALISKIIEKLKGLDEKKMLGIIALAMIVLKILCTVFFYYDGTAGGDISIYMDIAKDIISTGKLQSRAISHLYGAALHFVIFELLGMPIHWGMFICIFIGTLFNFLSFKRIIGKERAFLAIMAFVLMPSTSMMSFAPTHEIFAYMYISMFFYFYNRLLKEEISLKSCLLLLACVICASLTCLVNPGGYILYVIMLLGIILSSLFWRKKGLIALVLILTVGCGSLIGKVLNVNEFRTTMNTYTILIHGSNPESLGEQVDGYPLHRIREYIHTYTDDFSHEGFVEAAEHVLVSQYLHLLSHPITLFKLIVNKVYILWSGVHHPLEYAYDFQAFSSIFFYGLLAVNALIYLFMITMGLVYYRPRQDDIAIGNYILELLGVIALTLLCIVVNKYSMYVTAIIYLISFYRADLSCKEK